MGSSGESDEGESVAEREVILPWKETLCLHAEGTRVDLEMVKRARGKVRRSEIYLEEGGNDDPGTKEKVRTDFEEGGVHGKRKNSWRSSKQSLVPAQAEGPRA